MPISFASLLNDQLFLAYIEARYHSHTPGLLSSFFFTPDTGKLRLQKWYITLSIKEKAKIIKDVTTLTLGRHGRMCNFLEYKGA